MKIGWLAVDKVIAKIIRLTFFWPTLYKTWSNHHKHRNPLMGRKVLRQNSTNFKCLESVNHSIIQLVMWYMSV